MLAEWVAAPDNPLTARVMANRVWQHPFGRGIVRSSSDFGYGGTPPTHPELLDWLAAEFVARGWSLKAMHRLIVLSSAYRMSSRPDPAALARDPENDLFWRFDLRRLSAKEVRDSVLAVCGNLNPRMNGPSVYPRISAEVLAGQSRPGQGWLRSPPEEQARRSVYAHVKRSLAVPILASFDAADPAASCPVRFATTQPTQALGMLNGEFLNEQAAVFAAGLRQKAGDDRAAEARLALRRVAQREPTAAEVERGVAILARLRDRRGQAPGEALRTFCLLALNLNEFLYPAGAPVIDLQRPPGVSASAQRDLLDVLRAYKAEHQALAGDNPALAARVASYELAYKMQSAAPEAVDLSQESEKTKELYGLNDRLTQAFGRQCLLARRLVERGVRFIQIYSGGNHNDTSWDAHGDLVKNHTLHCGETDRPLAGLLTDLKRRGLLDSTLIVWGGEFGRQPTAEYDKGTGRDHNAYGFTMWLAGGGVRGGVSVGATDELGSAAVEKPFHVRRRHATILHQLGLDPERLTYFYSGLHQKLVGVEGAEPIREVIA